MLINVIEKLEINQHQNILIQGIPSSLEKQFVKLKFVKGMTPLLKQRKIDFALVFSINEESLNLILKEVFTGMQKSSVLWISFPKQTSKIITNLKRDSEWSLLKEKGYEKLAQIDLDHIWTSIRFGSVKNLFSSSLDLNGPDKDKLLLGIDTKNELITLPEDLREVLVGRVDLYAFYHSLHFRNKREYLLWINGAKTEATRQKRIEETLIKLGKGLFYPSYE